MLEIETVIDRETMEETSDVVSSEFAYRADYCLLHSFPGGYFPWHWHRDVEIFYMVKGRILYRIPGEEITFDEGDVGFINSMIPHATIAVDGGETIQQEHIFLPSCFLGARGNRVETKYVLPLLRNPSLRAVRIPGEHPISAQMVSIMDEACAAYEKAEFGYELIVQSAMARLWLLLLQFVPDHAAETGSSEENQRVKAMMEYIALHFGEKLTLAMIADAAHISPRECDRCFRRQLDVSPFDYVEEVRIGKACECLSGTDDAINVISDRCGFSSPSYFTKVFRQRMEILPTAYRRKFKAGSK